jgi:hypothetical protein
VDSTENLYQRALARAVVANQGHDLSGNEVQGNIFERSDSAEILGDTGGPNDRLDIGTSCDGIDHVESYLLGRGQWHVTISHDVGVGIKVGPLRSSRIM